jgi:Na+/proline symporter
MQILIFVGYLILFIAYGIVIYRERKNRADQLVEDILRSRK